MKKNTLVLSLLALLSTSGLILASGVAYSSINKNPLLTENSTGSTSDDSECQAALNAIDLNIDLTQVVNSFRLPSTGEYDTVITWSSSNTAVISITTDSAGKVASVTRLDADTTVTLTATATLNENTSSTRDFVLTVLKASSTAQNNLPLAMSEDFSSYTTGIELSNYAKWQCSSSETTSAWTVDSIDNDINDMESKRALAVRSTRTATAITYTRTINVTSDNAPDGAVLEGYFLFTGDTNGVDIEMTHSGNVIAGFSVSSSINRYYETGSYQDSQLKAPEEGVWEYFRLFFKTSTGRSIFQLYDWNSASYIDLTSTGASYVTGYGVASGNKGNVDGLRIRVGKGSNYGYTYLSDLHLDSVSNLPETTPTDPNRTMGIGNIENYESEIFAHTGETIVGTNPDFKVYNRFNESVLLTKDTDYTVSSTSETNDDNTTTYLYTFTLTSTGETKTVKQTVYITPNEEIATITDFKASYLKLKTTTESGVTEKEGYITLSGYVYRNDGTLYYLIVSKGSVAPSISQIMAGDSSITGYCTSGSSSITCHAFSLDSNTLSYSGEYDVYAVISNSYGNSPLYSSTGVSTVVNISTCQEFHDMSSDLDTLSSTFRLTKDLDFSSYYWDYDSASRSFTGVLDGQGHTIKNLTIANASEDTSVKTGIFFNFNGTVKNIVFDNVTVTGYSDVGILGGDAYGCTATDITFKDCTVKQDSSVSGGDGYFATAVGRCRGDTNTFSNITIDNSTIASPQRSGLLVAGCVGTSNDCTVNVDNIVASGSINEDGAHAGLIGRNQSATINVENAIVSLNVIEAKKEVGTILGRNETGGMLNANNIIGNLQIQDMTQPTYFGQFIGYDATTTSSGGKRFAYTCSNLYFLNNDYSALSDNITPIKTAIDAGTMVTIPTTFTQKWWETKTFLRDLDTSLVFSYDSDSAWPVLDIKSASDISFTAAQFEAMVATIDTTDIASSHYAIYKAGDMLTYMSSEEQSAVSSDAMSKYTSAKAAYLAMVKTISSIGEGI